MSRCRQIVGDELAMGAQRGWAARLTSSSRREIWLWRPAQRPAARFSQATWALNSSEQLKKATVNEGVTAIFVTGPTVQCVLKPRIQGA